MSNKNHLNDKHGKNGFLVMGKLFSSMNIFATAMSAADWAWKIITFLIVGGSGTVTGFIASKVPYFQQFGLILWVAIGLVVAICVALVIYLVSSAQNQMATARYTLSVSQPKSRVNPLLDSFQDLILPVEELRLPGLQVHENKHFKRCEFVGPASIALVDGCRLGKTGFIDCGDVIPLPAGTSLTGVIALKNCIIEECHFHKTTILLNEENAREMLKQVPGTQVAGYK
ncbi:TPA: hypothetical protein ACPVYA_004309 [Vibrio parahaemolyticus]|uniref:hypothetical protein n=1 Tax=Vibrio parahaemolyticus TaxID=670 RepID=UPI001114DCA3|nr:hypothetical protein [Vibrio parahaemolyticus]MBE4138110.1 hypothetical protein [Vibrio parahaemolyticus]MQF42688.1 hypothetical protein [Vibrio parahaemolyticus]HCE1985943.1 hypothetical protein [Vibrio parahaemolyticus]HCG9135956.1 hypothetical protein [Vibrio parahaemolyticus]HCH0342448.1 hypothetical protein [Vibrio parahaemolyticus]